MAHFSCSFMSFEVTDFFYMVKSTLTSTIKLMISSIVLFLNIVMFPSFISFSDIFETTLFFVNYFISCRGRPI